METNLTQEEPCPWLDVPPGVLEPSVAGPEDHAPLVRQSLANYVVREPDSAEDAETDAEESDQRPVPERQGSELPERSGVRDSTSERDSGAEPSDRQLIRQNPRGNPYRASRSVRRGERSFELKVSDCTASTRGWGDYLW
jgi:hypothetical protein